MSNSKKRNISLALGEDELLAVADQKYMVKAKEKNVVQNAWEAVVDELDFAEYCKNFFCYF